VSGNPDTTTLNEASIAVLDDTLRMLNEQVDKDTSSNEFMEELSTKLFQREHHEVDEIPETSKIFENFNLNPTSLPLKYLLNESFES
jgi:lipoate-protein ligase A